jgi:hypothetical protein
MPTFLAVYRGRTIGEARMVAVTAEPGLVAEVVDRLLSHPQMDDDDPVVRAIDRGRVTALRLIQHEHGDDHT